MPSSRRLKGGVGFFSRPASSTPFLKRMSRRVRGVLGRSSSNNRFGPAHRTAPVERRGLSPRPKKRSFTQRISRLFGYNKTPTHRSSPVGIELTNLRDRKVAPPSKIRPPLEPPSIDWIELTMDMIRSMTRKEKVQKLKELFDYPDRYLNLIGGYFPESYERVFKNFKNPALIQRLTDNQLGYVLIDLMAHFVQRHQRHEYQQLQTEIETLGPHIYVKKRSTDPSIKGFLAYNKSSVISELQSFDMETLIAALAKKIGPDNINKDTIIPLDMYTFETLHPFVAEMPSVYHEEFTLHL